MLLDHKPVSSSLVLNLVTSLLRHVWSFWKGQFKEKLRHWGHMHPAVTDSDTRLARQGHLASSADLSSVALQGDRSEGGLGGMVGDVG